MATRQAMLAGLVAARAGLAVWLYFRRKNSVAKRDPLVQAALCTFVSVDYAALILQKCELMNNKRLGELAQDEINKIEAVIANPKLFHTLPAMYMNLKDGKAFQLLADAVEKNPRESLERWRKAAEAAAKAG